MSWACGRAGRALSSLHFCEDSVGGFPGEDIRDAGSIPGSGRSLEEGMATHSSLLAWRIPQTEEPGQLQSTGSHQVGHN